MQTFRLTNLLGILRSLKQKFRKTEVRDKREWPRTIDSGVFLSNLVARMNLKVMATAVLMRQQKVMCLTVMFFIAIDLASKTD